MAPRNKIIEGREAVKRAMEKAGMPKKTADMVETLMFTLTLGAIARKELKLDRA